MGPVPAISLVFFSFFFFFFPLRSLVLDTKYKFRLWRLSAFAQILVGCDTQR